MSPGRMADNSNAGSAVERGDGPPAVTRDMAGSLIYKLRQRRELGVCSDRGLTESDAVDAASDSGRFRKYGYALFSEPPLRLACRVFGFAPGPEAIL